MKIKTLASLGLAALLTVVAPLASAQTRFKDNPNVNQRILAFPSVCGAAINGKVNPDVKCSVIIDNDPKKDWYQQVLIITDKGSLLFGLPLHKKSWYTKVVGSNKWVNVKSTNVSDGSCFTGVTNGKEFALCYRTSASSQRRQSLPRGSRI